MESLSGVRQIRKWLRFGTGLLAALWLASAACGQATIPAEYDVRAAIILNLTKFVVWPPAKTADLRAPFVVGLLGYDEQSAALERLLSGHSVDGRPIAIRRIAAGDRMSDCFLIYVAATERKRYEEYEPELTRAGALTISDDDRFVYSGGVVGLPVSKDHIEIQVNLAHAQLSGLTISSRLLQLATVVGR
jgi:hypothetical protein